MYFTESDSHISVYKKHSNVMENCYENAVLGIQHTTANSRKCHTHQAGRRTIDRVFQAVLAVQEVRFFSVSYQETIQKTAC